MARQVYLSIPHRSSFEFRRSKGVLGRETRVPWTWANCWMSLTLCLVRSRIRQWSAQMHYLEERRLGAQKPFLFESCKRWQYGSTQRLLWGEWKSPGEENDIKWQPWHHWTEKWNIFQQNQTNPRLFTVNIKFFTSSSFSQISLKPFHKDTFSQILSFWVTYMYMYTWMALHNISPAIVIIFAGWTQWKIRKLYFSYETTVEKNFSLPMQLGEIFLRLSAALARL